MTKRLSIEKCRETTNHALVPGTGFCACTHAMYDEPKEPELRCQFVRGGGGRQCTEVLGHKGAHIFQCGH